MQTSQNNVEHHVKMTTFDTSPTKTDTSPPAALISSAAILRCSSFLAVITTYCVLFIRRRMVQMEMKNRTQLLAVCPMAHTVGRTTDRSPSCKRELLYEPHPPPIPFLSLHHDETRKYRIFHCHAQAFSYRLDFSFVKDACRSFSTRIQKSTTRSRVEMQYSAVHSTARWHKSVGHLTQAQS